ncbi:hypothetical protein EG831_06885, partial [bacterium]|nr:hypothetical protein [bacterium]
MKRTGLFLLAVLLAAALPALGAIYYSQNNDAVSALTNWNTARDGSGAAPGAIGAGDTLVVQGGDSLWLTAAQTATMLDIETGGQVNAMTFAFTLASFTMRAGAEYIQGGAVQAIPSTVCSFDVASTYRFNGTQAGTSNTPYPEFGNLVWEPTPASAGTFQNSLTGAPLYGGLVVRGDLAINIQGPTKREVRFATGSTVRRNHTIDGDLVIFSTSSSVVLNNGTLTDTVNLGGDLIINAGIFKALNSTGTAVFNLGGSLLNYGDSCYAGNGAGTYVLNFTGTNGVNCRPGWNSNSFRTVNIPAGKVVNLILSDLNVLAGATFTNNGELYCTSSIVGAGDFTLASGATLGIGNASGLNGTVAVSGTKTYDAGASYIYNGTAAQVTGTDLPATVNDLTLNNAAGLTLSGPVTVNNVLSLTDGVITTDTSTLTIASDFAVNRTNGYVNGNLSMHVAAGSNVDKYFWLGTANGISGFDVWFNNVSTAGYLTATAIQSSHPDVNVANQTLQRYWSLSKDGSLAFDYYDVILQYNDADFTTEFPETDWPTMVAGKYDAGTWAFPAIFARYPGSNEVSIYNLTSFSDFTLGKDEASIYAGPADTIAPTIAWTTPATGATGVAPDAAIQIAFSEPMDTLSLMGGMLPPANDHVVWNATMDTLTQTHDPPALATTYTIAWPAG